MLPNFKNAECCSSNCVQKAIILAVIFAVKKTRKLEKAQFWLLSDMPNAILTPVRLRVRCAPHWEKF